MSDQKPTDIEIWNHFNTKPTFKTASDGWAPDDKKLFCRLVRAVHNAGLDWWHINEKAGEQVRFGRKEQKGDAKRTLAIIDKQTIRTPQHFDGQVGTPARLGKIEALPKDTPLNEELVRRIEDEMARVKSTTEFHKDCVERAEKLAFFPSQIPIGREDKKSHPKTTSSAAPKIFEETPKSDLNRTGNWIYYGPPGTGKTHKLNPILEGTYGKPPKGEPELKDDDSNKRYAFVTFHQSYGYEEFVEGLRPVLAEAGAKGGEVQYEIRAGVFKKLCEKAKEAAEKTTAGTPPPRYAMVIDEINRGNISKIFGELITLIEDDKREGEKNAIAITLPYSGESFSVPANVDIIGTMNTADRSLALLDTALRRRFKFVPMLPDTRDEEGAPLHKLEVEGIDIRLMLETMNKRIEVLYDRDHCIGHAYFTKLNKKEDEKPATLGELGAIFKNRIIPLLQEYFFEDWNKIRLVLGDNQKKDATTHFIKSEQPDLKTLFGNQTESLPDPLPPRFSLNDKDKDNAFDKPASYIGIYKTPDAV